MAASDFITDDPYHAGRVVRYHTWAVHHDQTVGEHSWQLYQLYAAIFGQPTAAVAHFIMNHDATEVVVGDPPYPVKAQNPDLKAGYDRLEEQALTRLGLPPTAELTERERWRIKVCDLLEMTVFGMVERQMGNLLAIPIIERTLQNAADIAAAKLPQEDAAAVGDYIVARGKRHQQVLRTGLLDD